MENLRHKQELKPNKIFVLSKINVMGSGLTG